MSRIDDFLELLRQQIGAQPPLEMLRASVKSSTHSMCSVELTDNGMEIDNVLLSATEENEEGWILVPKVNSAVLIAPLGNDLENLYLAKTTQLEKILLKIGDTRMEIDEDQVFIETQKAKIKINKDGFHIEKEGKDLKTILNGLVETLAAIVVVQGKGPDITQLQNIKNDINTLLWN